MMIYALVLALALVFGAAYKARSRGERATALAFLLSFLFLSAAARGYWRYIYTLYPFIIFAFVLYSWEWVKGKKPILRAIFFSLCAGIIAVNLSSSRDLFPFYWRSKVLASESRFPAELLAYINAIKGEDADSAFLVQSERQLFFYHTNKRGVDFRDPRMEPFQRLNDKARALDFLKNTLGIRYIYVVWDKTPSGNLARIVQEDCDSVYLDRANGFSLYRIRDRTPDKASLERLFINDSLLKNGSFEDWTFGPEHLPDHFEANDNVRPGMVSREAGTVKVGHWSIAITGDNFNLGQSMTDIGRLKGNPITVFVWMKTDVPDKYRIQIYDGKTASVSERHSGRGGWELLQANHRVSREAETLLVRVVQAEKTGHPGDVVFLDGALAVEGEWNTFYLYARSAGRAASD